MAPQVPRRRFLQVSSATGFALIASKSLQGSPVHSQSEPTANDTFLHGVASGDPLSDRVIIWTRVSGLTENSGPVSVSWSVATNQAMTDVIANGEAETSSERDWTVHVDVAGLRPATNYWYVFETGGNKSSIGRTRTARAIDDPGEIRLGVVSCAAWPGGFFTAYRQLAKRDIDLVVHLGDYIYESFREDHRDHDNPAASSTLEDYRGRYRQYRKDADLQAMHQRHPIATVWDDHEVAGNAWANGASSHNPSSHGPWQKRRSNAMQAYFEWLPVRRADPDKPERIWRSLPLGSAAELLLIDTRHDGRDQQVDDSNPDPLQAIDDPGRSMMSGEQREWLALRMSTSQATWRLVANQVMFSPFGIQLPGPLASFGDRFGIVAKGVAINPDSWDGYGGERSRVLTTLSNKAASNTVFLTGDVHSSWAFEVPGDGGPDNPVAVELVVPAVSSSPFGSLVGGSNDLLGDYLSDGNLINELVTSAIESQLSHLKWSEVSSNGYLLASITPERLWAEWWHLKGVGPNDKGEHLAAAWQVAAGTPRLVVGDPANRPKPRGAASTSSDKNKVNDRDANPPSPIAFGVAGVVVAAATGAAVAIRRRNTADSVGQDPPS